MEQNRDSWLGVSEHGFAAAANHAVEKYEEDIGPPPEGEPVTLRVIEMSVTVTNPLHDYRVVLGPSG
jgi:hypothetical protein